MTRHEQWLVEQDIEYDEQEGCYLSHSLMLRDPAKAALHRIRRDARQQSIANFSFAILTDELVQCLLPYGPFLEVGAGTGYWVWELQQAGAEVIATDPAPYTFVKNRPQTIHLQAEPLDALAALAKYGATRTLLMVWPSYQQPWPAAALRDYARRGGRQLVYVGEGRGDCCADDEFFDVLAEDWGAPVEQLPLRQWEAVHDVCLVYRR